MRGWHERKRIKKNIPSPLSYFFKGYAKSKLHLMITPGGNFTVEEGRSTVLTCKIVGGIRQKPILWYGLDDRQIKEDYR